MTMTFLATTKTGLQCKPISIDGAVSNIDDLLRKTKAFKSHYEPNPAPRGRAAAGKRNTDAPPPRQIATIRGDTWQGLVHLPTWHNGLIGTVVTAYNLHHNLELRPDDIWIAILCQFSAYVNGRAESLRSRFVQHEGKKELVVQGGGNIFTADFATMTRVFLDEISKNIKDSSMREWFLPGFSTTTKKDEVCASAAAMCGLQAYFEYKFCLRCGIPQVTLLGTVEDWQLLRTKIDRLLEFDTEGEKVMSKWVDLLRIVADNFLESAKSGSANNLHFWDTVASHLGGGSGPTYLSGWITVFSYFDESGKAYDESKAPFGQNERGPWPCIDTNDLVESTMSCPVKIDDNGTLYDGRLFVGQMSFEKKDVSDRPSPVLREGQLCMLIPKSDWALVVEGPLTEKKSSSGFMSSLWNRSATK